MLNPKDLASYTAEQVASLADIDWRAVRNEAGRRSDDAGKKLARALKTVEAARKAQDDAIMIFKASMMARDAGLGE